MSKKQTAEFYKETEVKRLDDGIRKLVMKFEDWWNTENKIGFSNEPDDYSKAKYVYEAVYNSMKNCFNCGKRRHCFLWHQVNNFSEANDVNYHCCMNDNKGKFEGFLLAYNWLFDDETEKGFLIIR